MPETDKIFILMYKNELPSTTETTTTTQINLYRQGFACLIRPYFCYRHPLPYIHIRYIYGVINHLGSVDCHHKLSLRSYVRKFIHFNYKVD